MFPTTETFCCCCCCSNENCLGDKNKAFISSPDKYNLIALSKKKRKTPCLFWLTALPPLGLDTHPLTGSTAVFTGCPYQSPSITLSLDGIRSAGPVFTAFTWSLFTGSGPLGACCKKAPSGSSADEASWNGKAGTCDFTSHLTERSSRLEWRRSCACVTRHTLA